jgi:hypothetical protein
MTAKRDLAEAHLDSRRRLVAALVTGGRDVEPRRPARTLVGGLALAVLLVGGGAMAGRVLHLGTGDDPPARGASHPQAP